jgi:hypothetical protein
MSELTIDSALISRLKNLHGTTAIRDESGRVLGYFVPAAEAGSLWPAADGCPFTAEQSDRFRRETGGKQLSEIWKCLGQS